MKMNKNCEIRQFYTYIFCSDKREAVLEFNKRMKEQEETRTIVQDYVYEDETGNDLRFLSEFAITLTFPACQQRKAFERLHLLEARISEIAKNVNLIDFPDCTCCFKIIDHQTDTIKIRN